MSGGLPVGKDDFSAKGGLFLLADYLDLGAGVGGVGVWGEGVAGMPALKIRKR